MKLSVRIEKSKQLKGQAGHDFDDRPEYADPERKHLNHVMIGGTQNEVISLIEAQANSIKVRFNENAEKKRAATISPKEKRKIGSWRKTTATHKTMIITFCSEFRARKNEINKSELDECAEKFLKDFCKKNRCEPTYLVRHDDETSTHYHATFTNVNQETLKPLRFQMKDLSELQDEAGEHFSKMGITRGIKRNERLDIARTNNPQFENESIKEYKKRIYKLANVVHKSVGQMHEDLPNQLAKKEAELTAKQAVLKNTELRLKENKKELESAKLELSKAVGTLKKNQRLIELSKIELQDLVVKNEGESEKSLAIKKRISVYEKRVANTVTKIKELSQRPWIENATEVVEIIKQKNKFKPNEVEKISIVKYEKLEDVIIQAKRKEAKYIHFKNLLKEKEATLNTRESELDQREQEIEETIQQGVTEYIKTHAEQIAVKVKLWATQLVSDTINQVVAQEPFEVQVNYPEAVINEQQKTIEDKIEDDSHFNFK